jgi:hypothetical protein
MCACVLCLKSARSLAFGLYRTMMIATYVCDDKKLSADDEHSCPHGITQERSSASRQVFFFKFPFGHTAKQED